MADKIRLPSPREQGEVSFEGALARRRSVRTFAARALTASQLGQLMWSAQGLSSSEGLRTAPSAGALYPLEIYAVTAEGFFHYAPVAHALYLVRPQDLRPGLYAVGLHQEALLEAPLTVVFAAVCRRTEAKYGRERSPRYVFLEVGHSAQNLLLQAVTLGLAAVPIGAFEDLRVKALLGLPAEQDPLYLVPVGYPA